MPSPRCRRDAFRSVRRSRSDGEQLKWFLARLVTTACCGSRAGRGAVRRRPGQADGVQPPPAAAGSRRADGHNFPECPEFDQEPGVSLETAPHTCGWENVSTSGDTQNTSICPRPTAARTTTRVLCTSPHQKKNPATPRTGPVEPVPTSSVGRPVWAAAIRARARQSRLQNLIALARTTLGSSESEPGTCAHSKCSLAT